MKKQVKLYSLGVVLTILLAACSPVSQVISNQVGKLQPVLYEATTVATPTVQAPVPGDQAPLEAMASIQGVLETIYNKVNPSVVNITVSVASTGTSRRAPSSQDQSQSPQQQALGSGFVWDKSGHIVTNNHVVDGATDITVTFVDGTTVPAKLVGADKNSDLAVIKVDVSADLLQPVQMGDSQALKVGQLAIAIGNPFGLEGTMTFGIISALGRSLPVASTQSGPSYSIPDVIQTDAPINPGNSGGVLVNDLGQVIGVTAAIESSVNSSAGIGFAIPSEIVQKVVPELIRTGHYEYTWLGIQGGTLTPELAAQMDLKATQRGVLVSVVTPGGPAEKAGLKGSDKAVVIDGIDVKVGGDVIIAVDGQPVNKFEDLISYLASSTSVGQTIQLTILRQGSEMQVKLVLTARPATS